MITSRAGLLWEDGKPIPLPRADAVAQKHGYMYAEQMVRALEGDVPPYADLKSCLMQLYSAAAESYRACDDSTGALWAALERTSQLLKHETQGS